MLSSPHRVTSPEPQYRTTVAVCRQTTAGRTASARRRSYKRRCNGRERTRGTRESSIAATTAAEKKSRPGRTEEVARERGRSYKASSEQQQQQQQQSQKPEKIAPRQPLPRARAPPPPEPGKLVPRQPIGRPAELPQQPQQPRQPRVVDEVTSESRPTSIRDIMVKKARDERKTEMRAKGKKNENGQI